MNSQVIQADVILKLCALDFFSTEKVFVNVFGLENGEPFSQKFEDSGLEGHNFIMGIGPVFFYILAFPQFILIHKLSQRLCKDEWMLEKFNKKKEYSVMVLTFLFGACFELNISACISIAKIDKGDFTSFWSIVSIVLAFLTLAALAMAPLFLLRASKRYFKNSDDEDYREIYKGFFEDKRDDNIYALNY